MDKYQLRTTILKLLDRLSDHDRQRLHFLLANDVPRPIRDNASTSGTLFLMESLFDQDKLSEENFTILIDAFKAIRCVEGLKILKEHKKRVYVNQRNAPCISLYDQIVLDQEEEDKSPTQSLLYQIKNSTDHSQFIKNNSNTNINPVTINVDTKCPFSKEKSPFYFQFQINKCLFPALGFLLAVVMTIAIITFIATNFTSREKVLLKQQSQSKQTIESLENQLFEQKKNITRLEEEKNNLPIKPGEIFGLKESDAISFDDSSSSDFECSHYLNEILVRHDEQGFETYQFSYYSPSAKYKTIQSAFHGNEQFRQRTEFDFLKEKISRVEGQIVSKTFHLENGTELIKSVITGIKFITKDNHANHLFNQSSGVNFSEAFLGYTLGYATGRANQYIEQIQFYWYRI